MRDNLKKKNIFGIFTEVDSVDSMIFDFTLFTYGQATAQRTIFHRRIAHFGFVLDG